MKAPIDLQLGNLATRISNNLHDEMTPAELTQDILVVELRTGFLIDVGWYPENDPNGEFWIRVFTDQWRSQVTKAIKTPHIHAVVLCVYELAQHFGDYRGGGVAFPDSSFEPEEVTTV